MTNNIGPSDSAEIISSVLAMGRALIRFSRHEYGKFNKREKERISNALKNWANKQSATSYPEQIFEAPFKTNCWGQISWRDTLDQLPTALLSHCHQAALTIAHGSGRRAISEAMHARIDALFADGFCDDIEYTYQDHCASLLKIENSLPPIYLRYPTLRVKFLSDGAEFRVEVSVIPWSQNSKGFVAFDFSTKRELPLLYSQIIEATDLDSGEILNIEQLFEFISPGRVIPKSIKNRSK